MGTLTQILRAGAARLVGKGWPSYAPGDGSFTPPSSWPIGWWQQGYRLPRRGGSAAAEACVAAISQTIASMPIQLWQKKPDGGMEEIIDGPVARVLRKPNAYQTRADFFLNLLRTELFEGNGVAVAQRANGQITSLHVTPPNSAVPYVAPDGSVFYSITSTTPLLPEPPVESFFPAEDVLHLRMQTPRHPLIGESPIVAATMAVESAMAISGHMSSFFRNMTRPSGYLTTPKVMKAELADQLRQNWEQAYSADNSGQIAVLMDGLEWKPLSITSVDAQLIESYKLSTADIARVYRVPLAVIGEMGGATFNNTESLIRHWMSTGLGYILEHIELSLDALFRLPADQFTAFDVDALMRSDFPARIEALTKGITGGLFSPNEARGKEGLSRKEGGDEPRLQAQVVPLSFAYKTPEPAAPSNPTAPSAPAVGDDEKVIDQDMALQRYLAILRSHSDAA